jgi:Na+/H+ antiporter NhaD/arsenite permease-like protein
MKETVLLQPKRRIKMNIDFLKKDIVFTISLLLATISCLFHLPKIEYINFHVLISLFTLMIAIKAFEELKVLDKVAIHILNKSQNSRAVSATLILLCFFSSMFVTNDVALLTFVPLALLIGQKTKMPMMETIILQTIAANLGSSLTPMGNPQNLFIYSHYELTPLPFFMTVLFLAIIGLSVVYFMIHRLPKRELQVNLIPEKMENKHAAFIWGIVLAVIIASIFGFIPYAVSLMITLFAALILNWKILLKIDYFLLITFVCFFIFIGNISNLNVVQTLASEGLKDSTSVFFVSILSSQFISNVPASLLLASFTEEWQPLLLGVNIGGLGTIIASLASVISYKLFLSANPEDGKKYFIQFSIYNFGFLVVLILIQYMFIHLMT